MIIKPIEFDDEVRRLLLNENLPTDDIGDSTSIQLFGMRDNERLIGIIGIETYDHIGLLRSLVVEKAARDTGHGKKLVANAEHWCCNNNIASLYLLTTTAAGFFTSLGYKPVSRTSAPLPIVQSAQFSELCPSSAVFMHKALSTTNSSRYRN